MSESNSIASMATKTTNSSREFLALKAAFEATGIKKAALARKVGVASALVWQWLDGRTPVPADKAVRVAEALSTDPKRISAAYAEVAANEPSSALPDISPARIDERRPELVIARLENDIHALSYAVSALIAATTSHRPVEARALAGAIRRRVPAKFRDKGLVHELLVTLDRATPAD